jgi:excisionase family DNA binding protein
VKTREREVEREFYSLKEVQTILGCGQSKIYDMVGKGELPAVKLGRVLRIHRADLADWRERNRYGELEK